MKVSASVMAHVSRAGMVNELVGQLDGDVDVVYDTLPPSRDREQRWGTAMRAWGAFDPTADFHVVIQDDAILCEDFLAGLSVAVSHVGRPAVVSAYMGAGRPVDRSVWRAQRLAARLGHSWAQMPLCYWGVAVALPTEVIPGLLGYRHNAQRNYDTRLARYFRDVVRLPTLYTVPSLADHRHGPSLVGHDVEGRRAANFITGSPLAVDWSRLPSGWHTQQQEESA